MKLKAKQQVHVSAIRSDTIRPGEVIEVSDDRGKDLLRSLPATFERVDEPAMAIAEPIAEVVNDASQPAPRRARRTGGKGGSEA